MEFRAPAPAPRTSGTPPCRSTLGMPAGAGPVQPQGRNHRDCPPGGGGRADYPLPPRRPAVGRRQRRSDPRLVDENQPFRLDLSHLPSEPTRLFCTSGRSRWVACRLFFLRVKPRRSRANQSVFRLHGKTPRCLSCSSVASGWSRTNPASRSRSPGSRAGAVHLGAARGRACRQSGDAGAGGR